MTKKSVLLVYDENPLCQVNKETMHDETTEVHDTPLGRYASSHSDNSDSTDSKY